MRHLVLAVYRRQPFVVQRHAFARIFERRPDDVFDACLFGCPGHCRSLLTLALRRKVFPEIGHTEDSVCACKSPRQTGRIVGIASHDFCAKFGECLRLFGIGLAGDRTHGKRAIAIGQNRANQTATLRTCRTHYCDDFLFSHDRVSFCRFADSGGRACVLAV